MGKDKPEKFSHMDYYSGGKVGKLAARYGVDGIDMSNRPGMGENRSYADVERDIAKAASNDYDTRRGLEAAGLSGNKKAQKFAENGMRNIQDVYGANKFLKKQHKKMGNGGDYSSASDYAGVTNQLVQQDRKRQTEQYNQDYALNTDLAALREEMNNRGDQTPENTVPAKLSETAQESQDQSEDYDLNLGSAGSDIFGGGSSQEENQAQNFANNAVGQVKKGLQLSDVETRGPRSGIREGEGF
jgi:hypothetical protein